MRRSFWFAAGAGASVYAMNRVNRLREAATTEGLKDRLGALALGARLFRDELAQGQAEKETELRERLGLAPDMTPQLEARPPGPGAGRHRLDSPAATSAHEITNDKEGTH